MSSRLLAVVVLAAIVVLFFAINLFAGAALRSARIDLTEDNLYTLPAGARAIARDIGEPIRVKFYFSRDLAAGRPDLTSHAQRVEDTLRAFAAASDGKIELEIIDPEPMSEAEDEAMAAGLQGQRANLAGDLLYFGMVATNSTDGREVVAFFNPADERLLNYDLARRLHVLAHPDRPKIAVMSGLPIGGAPANQLTGQPPQEPWQIVAALRSLYEVQIVEPTAPAIPEDAGLLLVVFPRQFTSAAWYAIDQFVMRGGRAIFALDPHCLNYMPPESAQDQMAIYTADRSADLGPLGAAWGVDIKQDTVAADQASALSVSAPDGSGRAVSYPVFMVLTEDRLAGDDPVVASLATITVYSGGVLEVAQDSPLAAEPLLETSAESMEVSVERIRFPNPEELVRDFAPSGTPLTIAARLSGPLTTAFPDGPPPNAQGDAGGQVRQTSAPAEIVILTDADMLSDSAWIQPVRLGGQVLGYQPVADNGSLVMNAAENLLGSSALTSIRASAASIRPFTRVQEIQRAAEREFAAEHDAIQQELSAVEQNINNLLRGQAGAEVQLTADVQAELERFRETRVELRQKARAANYRLTADVERLDTQMRLINIALVPAAVTVFAIGLAVYRGVRRRGDRSGRPEGARA